MEYYSVKLDSDRQTSHDITYMSKKTKKQKKKREIILKIKIDLLFEHTLKISYQRGVVGGWGGGLEACNCHMHTVIYGMTGQQGPAV